MKKMCFAATIASFMVFSASALDIDPSDATFTSNETGNLSAADVEDITGCDNLTELYKSDANDDGSGTDSGPFADSYNTTFSNDADDPEDADIVHVNGEPSIPPQDDCLWLLVKDGSQSPAQYLIDLSALGWNGTESLNLTGFWPQQGAISHIAIYGTVNGNGVPDGGLTIVLLGAAISAIGLVSRRLKS